MSPSVFEKLLVAYARRFPIRSGKSRVIDAFWRIAAGDRCARRLAELNHGQFKMPCDLREMMQRQFYFFGTYFFEEHILDCWQNAARHARVVFDVGANAGIFSLAALAARRNATVHAFEPTREIAARLRETAALNALDHLHVHEVAVSNENGTARLNRCRGELGTNDGMNFITTDVEYPGAELVDTICLDQFCRDHSIDFVDLLKIDIQGNEHLALAGAKRLLEDKRAAMVFLELNWGGNSGTLCPATDSIRILQGAGYRFSIPGRRLNWLEAGEWLRTLTDVVAAHPMHLRDLQLP